MPKFGRHIFDIYHRRISLSGTKFVGGRAGGRARGLLVLVLPLLATRRANAHESQKGMERWQ